MNCVLLQELKLQVDLFSKEIIYLQGKCDAVIEVCNIQLESLAGHNNKNHLHSKIKTLREISDILFLIDKEIKDLKF